MKSFIKATVLTAVVATAALGMGIANANAQDPYLRNLETRRFYDARDARDREAEMGMKDWLAMAVGSVGRPVGSRVVQPTTQARTNALAAPNKAARDAHFQALMQNALKAQSTRNYAPVAPVRTNVRAAAPVKTYTQGGMSAAQGLAITNTLASREAHNRELMQKALNNQSNRR